MSQEDEASFLRGKIQELEKENQALRHQLKLIKNLVSLDPASFQVAEKPGEAEPPVTSAEKVI